MTGLEIAGFALIAIGACGLAVACWAQRREIERLRSACDTLAEDELKALVALNRVANATADIKHGTARKVHRMAREAIDG